MQITSSAGKKRSPAVTPVTAPFRPRRASPASPSEFGRPGSRSNASRHRQGLRTTFNVAELLLKKRFARVADPADPGRDPGRRDVVGILEKLQLHEPTPKLVISAFAGPLSIQSLAETFSRSAKRLALRCDEHLQAVAQFFDGVQQAGRQEGNGISPFVQFRL